jgi:hypothetical protein
MATWVQDDKTECTYWFYNVRGSAGTTRGPEPVEYPIAMVEYWKKDPLGYRASAKNPGEAHFHAVGIFDGLPEAKAAAENGAAKTLQALGNA